jgi:hypothetical protein
MTFPTPELRFTFRVALLLVSGFVATFAYYWVVAKLKREGIRTPMFGNVRGLLKTFETYRRLAPEQSWPTWPITAFWIAGAIGFATVASIYFIPMK